MIYGVAEDPFDADNEAVDSELQKLHFCLLLFDEY